jgi:hypothetical protein
MVGMRTASRRLRAGDTNLEVRQREWATTKPRSDVDTKNAILPYGETYYRRPGSENPRK